MYTFSIFGKTRIISRNTFLSGAVFIIAFGFFVAYTSLIGAYRYGEYMFGHGVLLALAYFMVVFQVSINRVVYSLLPDHIFFNTIRNCLVGFFVASYFYCT